MEYIDYYHILGVDREATAAEISQAYRRLARKYHPDVNEDPGAEARFKEVTEAYEVLKDPDKRAEYDRFGQAWGSGGHGGGAWPPGWDVHVDFGDAGGSGFSSFFEHLFGGRRTGAGDTPFADLFGGRGSQASLDREATLVLSLEEACRGGRHTVSLQGDDGTRTTLQVTIPAAITNGTKLRLAGQGGTGAGGRRGDLLLVVRHRPHGRFRLDGRDLHTVIDVPPPVAVLGGKVRLKTLARDVMVAIPPTSSSGRRIRLRGQGWPGGDATASGDLYAEVRIVAPETVTPEQRSLYERLAALHREEVAP